MHGLYELPGGKLEEGETPKQTAKIETKRRSRHGCKNCQRTNSSTRRP